MENNIRYVRKLRDMTMKELGARVDAAESTISQYETGKREPDNEMLLKIAEALDTTVDYLLRVSLPPEFNDEEKSLAKYLDRIRNDSRTRALLDASENMTDDEMEQMTAFARFLRRNY